MKDPMDTLTADLLAPPDAPIEHEGEHYTLFADHENEIFMMINNETDVSYLFYDEAAREFWKRYIKGLHANAYDPDKTLHQLFEEYENEL